MAPPSPLVFIPLNIGQKMADRFRWAVGRVLALFPSLKYELREFGIFEPDAYVASALASSVLSALLFGAMLFVAAGASPDPQRTQNMGILAAVGMCLVFVVFNMLYPGIKTRSIAMKVDRDLSFALKDMLVQVESGIPLYEAMVNIGHSDYGSVSKDFSAAVKEISAGTPEAEAIQNMALKSKSEYFKKALWQLVSTLQSGASLGPALRSVIETLDNYQRKSIKDYSASLNFIVLIYMLVAAAVPSMGMTFLIVLSAFGGVGVNEQIILMILAASVLLQTVFIGYMSSSRPAVYE